MSTVLLIIIFMVILLSMYMNYDWYRTCQKMNETWHDFCNEVNNEWFDHFSGKIANIQNNIDAIEAVLKGMEDDLK